ncbi:MAG: phosphatidate cytidylyltransferase [Butyrivibrio sp.]|nr:phosphatidate cytidylyltransferase [Butyrivibrio sp.]
MKTRVISGIVIALLLVVFMMAGGYPLGIILLLLSLSAYYELTRAFGEKKESDKSIDAMQIWGYIVIFIHYLFIMWKQTMDTYIFSVMLAFFGIMIIYVIKFPKYKVSVALYSVFSFVYAPIMLSFIYMLRIMENGKFLAWLPFVAWICDTCAYFAGRTLGKHKMTPVLSPKKTIEGAIGGIIGSVVAGAIYGLIYANVYGKEKGIIIAFVIITFVASIISQIGDLTASGIKREHNIKDYGNLIPGHGGIMDRFDSVIFVAPMIYFLAAALL